MYEQQNKTTSKQPQTLGSPYFHKLHSPQFQSPIQFVEHSANQKHSGSSPEQDNLIKYSSSFKNIIQRQNQDQSSEDGEHYYKYPKQIPQSTSIDLFGNPLPICQFYTEDGEDNPIPTIIQDKQNSGYHTGTLYTPMKNNKDNALRSPLRDITPQITKHKKSALTTISSKTFLLTPRTLTESRISGSGLRKIQRI